MPAFHELLEIICSYLKVIGYLYILRQFWLALVCGGWCRAMAFSRADRIVGGDSETTGQKLHGPRLTQPSVLSRTPECNAIRRVMTKKSIR